jgi:hypothetical protein
MKNTIRKASGFLLAISCLATVGLKAQNWEWVTKSGGTNADLTWGVSTDPSGNVFTTGSFSGTATFGSTSLISSGGTDIFIAKQDVSGTYLWAVKAGGTGTEEGLSIAVDAAGNSFVTGYFNGTTTFGSTTLTSSNKDAFLARYDNAGTLVWVVQAGGTGIDIGNKVSISGSGNHAIVCVAGIYNGTGTFGTTSLTSAGTQDLFVMSYDGGGNFTWANSFGGTSTDAAKAIAQDATGNIYLAGDFQGTATFGSYSLTATGATIDVFIAKLTSAGVVSWIRQGTGNNNDFVQAITVDRAGNIYASGMYSSSTFSFGTVSLSVATGLSGYLVKYNNAGTEQWIRRVVTGASGYCTASGVAIDDAGNFVYVTGLYTGTGTFMTNVLSNSGQADVYISRYNLSGVESAVVKAGGFNNEESNEIAINSLDHVYIAGSFNSGTSVFSPVGVVLTTGGYDGFVAKFDVQQWPVTVGGPDLETAQDIAVDDEGNSYITGVFSGTLNFGSFSLTSSGIYTNIYVAKYSTSGICLWAHRAYATPSGCGGGISRSIAIDPSGNCYIGGNYSTATDFDGIILPSSGGCNGGSFIAKYNSAGTIQWAMPIQSISPNGAAINSIACDASSNVYATGFFTGTLTVGAFSAPAGRVFTFKLNSSGTCQWLQAGTGNEGRGITTDGTNVYVTGEMSSSATFGAYTATCPTGTHMFIVKYSVAGTVLGAVGPGPAASGSCIPYDITNDNSGNIYITGGYGATTNFGTHSVTSAGGYDSFVAKYSSALTNTWVKSGGGPFDDNGWAIKWDNYGLFVVGEAAGGGTFGAFTYTYMSGYAMFYARYNASTGSVSLFEQLGISNYDRGIGVDVDARGNAYIGGSFSTTSATFGSSVVMCAGNHDIFIEKLNSADATFARLAEEETASAVTTTGGVSIYPNPNNGAFIISIDSDELKNIQVFDVMGKLIFTINHTTEKLVSIDLTSQPGGIYLVRVINGNSVETQRIIKQ